MKRNFLTHNLGMKFIALLITVGLWFFVAATLNNVSKFPGSIAVKAVNTPENLSAIYDTKEVELKVSADPGVWKQLSSENFSAFVDLNGLTAGTHDLKVIVNSNLPGVEVVDVTPSTILVRLEVTASKQVDVIATVSGQAAENLTTGLIEFDPDKITVSGPKSLTDTVNSATAEIKLSGESADFERQISLKIINDKGEEIKDLTITPAEVKAKVKIVKSGNNKTVGIKVNTSGFPATGFYIGSITTDPSTVDIIGQDSVLRGVQFIETQTIDLTGLNSTLVKTVSLSLPSGISLQRDSNQKIKVTINFSVSEVTKELSATIIPLNLAPGLKISNFDPATVRVIVSGPADQIASLKSSDVLLNLDLLGRSTGSIGIDLSRDMFKALAGISISSFLPSSITVTLGT